MPITNSGYGVVKGKFCTEGSPLRPVSSMAATRSRPKIILDRENSVSLRLATVFGMAHACASTF